MKFVNYFFALIAITIAIIFFSNPKMSLNENKITGSWQGLINSSKIKFSFFDGNFFTLKIFDQITSDTTIIKGNYEYKENKIPAPLTLKNIKEINHPLHTSLNFVTSDSIRIAFFSNRLKTRPIMINSENSFGLKLIKNKNLEGDFIYD